MKETISDFEADAAMNGEKYPEAFMEELLDQLSRLKDRHKREPISQAASLG